MNKHKYVVDGHRAEGNICLWCRHRKGVGPTEESERVSLGCYIGPSDVQDPLVLFPKQDSLCPPSETPCPPPPILLLGPTPTCETQPGQLAEAELLDSSLS